MKSRPAHHSMLRCGVTVAKIMKMIKMINKRKTNTSARSAATGSNHQALHSE